MVLDDIRNFIAALDRLVEIKKAIIPITAFEIALDSENESDTPVIIWQVLHEASKELTDNLSTKQTIDNLYYPFSECKQEIMFQISWIAEDVCWEFYGVNERAK